MFISEETKQLLTLMGHYFELDAKAVRFWIKQMELTGKIKPKPSK